MNVRGFLPIRMELFSPYSLAFAAAALAINSPMVKKSLKGFAVTSARIAANLALEVKDSTRKIKNEVTALVTEAYAEREMKKIINRTLG